MVFIFFIFYKENKSKVEKNGKIDANSSSNVSDKNTIKKLIDPPKQINNPAKVIFFLECNTEIFQSKPYREKCLIDFLSIMLP